MKYISIDVIQQRWSRYSHEKWLPCIECNKAESRMLHIRLNPKNLGEHKNAVPLGGVYCYSCTLEILEMLTGTLKELRI